jgi:Resolvase, N terminal domain
MLTGERHKRRCVPKVACQARHLTNVESSRSKVLFPWAKTAPLRYSRLMKIALYLRVSTKPRIAKPGQKVHYDPPREQTVENQRLKLHEFAAAMDWSIVAEFEDQESGAKSTRPGFNAMI